MQTNQLALAALLLPILLGGCLGGGTLDDEVDCDATGRQLIDMHCLGCHAAARSGGERGGAPGNMNFDTDADVFRHLDDIREAAIERQSMPPGRPFASCEQENLDAYLRMLDGGGTCEPSCQEKSCGADGCGGVCGTCDDDEYCDGGRCMDGGDLSYERDVMPIWRHHGCASAGCHGGANPSERLNLSTARSGYEALIDRDSRQCTSMELVDPGDADGSYLMNKLLGRGMCKGTRMPRGGTLTPEQISVIRAWIEGGAAR